MCEVCERNDHTKTLATIVHHVEEIRTPIGWEKRLDINNLESICQSCHNKEDHAHSFKNAGRANHK
ncbi:MAG: HNH endonuclease [Veillonella sp.]|nr:HNH endonuclease [Veillonella sp.]